MCVGGAHLLKKEGVRKADAVEDIEAGHEDPDTNLTPRHDIVGNTAEKATARRRDGICGEEARRVARVEPKARLCVDGRKLCGRFEKDEQTEAEEQGPCAPHREDDREGAEGGRLVRERRGARLLVVARARGGGVTEADGLGTRAHKHEEEDQSDGEDGRGKEEAIPP